MKKITRLLMAFVATFFCFNTTQAQDDFDALMDASLQDANKLIHGYMDPFMKGFGAALGASWYHTAKAHKSAGFDITATVSLAYVPDKDMFYNINSSLQTTQLVEDQAPTVFGPNVTPNYSYTYEDATTGQTITETFTGPPGIGLKDEFGMNAMPIPMVQLGIGIIKNTDIKIRWTPEIDLGDGTMKVLGFGVMHDVKQHIPGIKNLPFDLSALVAFTDVTTRVDLDDDFPDIDNRGEFDINTWTVQGIISKKFSVLTVYGGLGFNRVRSDLKMLGEYEVGSGTESVTITDPVTLSFKSGGPRLTAGMRLKLAILTLHADYTLQRYKTLTVGVGFSVR